MEVVTYEGGDHEDEDGSHWKPQRPVVTIHAPTTKYESTLKEDDQVYTCPVSLQR